MLDCHSRTGHSNQYRLFGRGAFIGNEPKLSIALAKFQEFGLLLRNLLIQGCHYASSFRILPRNSFRFFFRMLDGGLQSGKSKDFVAGSDGRLTLCHLVGNCRLPFLFLGQLGTEPGNVGI